MEPISQNKTLKYKWLQFLKIFSPESWRFISNYQKGIWAMTSHRFPEAINYFKRSLQFRKDHLSWQAMAYQGLGCCYFDIKNFENSKFFLTKALEISPKEKTDKTYGVGSEISSRLGVIHAKEGNYEKAKDYLENALQCKPKPFTGSRSYTNWKMVEEWLSWVNQQMADAPASGTK